jgi:hypothetical protein
MAHRLGGLAEPYRTGRARRFARAARALTAAGAAVVGAAGRRSRALAIAGGGAVLAGAACQRFAVFEAGRASAADPGYTVAPQRERLAARS